MPRTVYRKVGSVRRTPKPRRITRSSGGLTAAFEGLLAKLTFASGRLQASRPRR